MTYKKICLFRNKWIISNCSVLVYVGQKWEKKRENIIILDIAYSTVL